ncbi:hypothetical protein KZZ52_20210 [Dactylosporangium sp. AC04546]|uniref:hypothetical protein n=1 Tax=Dactylosporangium sp. AC04546 TaxID=2862460 RepID=UPI001EDDF28C|nr:hypothetical protein [Dactylosporangium sp. AC04546]WVK87620.1 hypothetical protein KZZ52_20210 [Dactylosporangium sp. AC04546]
MDRRAEGGGVQQARFVFLALAAVAVDDPGAMAEAVTWMLVSPNNRPLGRAARTFDSLAASREAVQSLRDGFSALRSTVAAVESSGHWVWRVDLAGAVVGISSRSYLRARECHYNLARFLEAVPAAVVAAGTRSVRGGRPPVPNRGGDTAALTARPAPRGARTRAQDVPAPGARPRFI